MANPTHDQVLNTLRTNYPTAQWNFGFPDLNTVLYSNFIWFDDPATKPSAADLGF
jgi:hypothetical protein